MKPLSVLQRVTPRSKVADNGVGMGWVPRAYVAAAGFALIVGCGSDDEGRGSAGAATTLGGTGIASVGDGQTAGDTSDSGQTGMGAADGDSGGGPPKFDVPMTETEGTNPDGEGGGCEKVDVVMAVDNSGSMQEEIEVLQGPVFDSFPDALLAVNGGLLDFQLAVIDACNDPPHYHNHGDPGDCNFANGANYMVSSNPALEAEYACVTQLSTSGWNGMGDGCSGSNDDEQPANTAADAVSLNGGANMGFLRDDAVLLVVAITDEDEKPLPAQSAQEVANKIIGAAGGIENVVFLGIAGASDCEGPYGGADDAAFLREITQIFVDANRGLFWDLCMGNLENAFQSVVDVVDVACMEFEPEG